ncbi:MAG: HNH endonuclease family protein [Isosphaeraceae bacterium]
MPSRRLYILLRLDSKARTGVRPTTTGDLHRARAPADATQSLWCEWFPTQELRDKYVHRIGNLLLLNQRKNSSASNREFTAKKQSYFAKGGVSPFALTSQAISQPEWTEEVVKRRQDELVGKLKELWRL